MWGVLALMGLKKACRFAALGEDVSHCWISLSTASDLRGVGAALARSPAAACSDFRLHHALSFHLFLAWQPALCLQFY